jgi:peptidoglycan/xylan/chitin deacetylase (PgdA/CDA1 family)
VPKKPLRKKTTRKIKANTQKNKISYKFVAVLVLFVALFGIGFIIKKQSISISPETEKTEVKKLPPDIKKEISTAASTAASFRVPILMYHYVEYVQDKKDTIRQSLNVNPYVFEQQIKTLREDGYTFMTASELSDVLDGRKQMPDKPILITFDDGHWDLYTDVLPILKKYNVKATAYIITGFLNGSDFLTTAQLKELASSGNFEIGSHTVNHAWLKGRSKQSLDDELIKSKITLQELINKPVVSFAYPYGAFDQQAEEEVKNAGYKSAVITVPGIVDSVFNRFFLFRLRPGGRTGDELLNYLEQTTFNPY